MYDFIISPLVNQRQYRSDRSCSKSPLQLTQNCCNLDNVYAKIVPSMHLESEVQHIRERAEYCLCQEIELAEYFRIGTMIIDIPINSIIEGNSVENMCRIINGYLPNLNMDFVFRVPLVIQRKEDYSNSLENGDEHKDNPNVAWTVFQKVKRLCNYHNQIKLCLDITRDLPDDKDIERWCAENLKMITVSKKLFITNKKGFPVLSRAHQRIVKKFITYHVKI